ncbi:endonuclease domain-containing protein [Streptomyces sp. SR27]|uniref:endonuclease domain-containing protein n=1 Tax=Streptomyces sp. SR27 TaxID=3076630 RepID=UPI00295AA071|nr:endonuclease domain-containing protein [Streptomyces sp. SR27]MDV9186823.1 endonuclease domain-containing protein [Streptomyces sp. SR27]
MAPTDFYASFSRRPFVGAPPGYNACRDCHLPRPEDLGPALAREDLRTGLYHLWRERPLDSCPNWEVCGAAPGPWEAIDIPNEHHGEVVLAASIPANARCYPSRWPLYVERKTEDSLPDQWREDKIPRWYVWWRLFELQKGRCACCLISPEVIDHDHRSGAVRGLLCVSCNKLEGMYFRRERLCFHEPPYCFEEYWRKPPALPLRWQKKGSTFMHRHRK